MHFVPNQSKQIQNAKQTRVSRCANRNICIRSRELNQKLGVMSRYQNNNPHPPRCIPYAMEQLHPEQDGDLRTNITQQSGITCACGSNYTWSQRFIKWWTVLSLIILYLQWNSLRGAAGGCAFTHAWILFHTLRKIKTRGKKTTVKKKKKMKWMIVFRSTNEYWILLF